MREIESAHLKLDSIPQQLKLSLAIVRTLLGYGTLPSECAPTCCGGLCGRPEGSGRRFEAEREVDGVKADDAVNEESHSG